MSKALIGVGCALSCKVSESSDRPRLADWPALLSEFRLKKILRIAARLAFPLHVLDLGLSKTWLLDLLRLELILLFFAKYFFLLLFSFLLEEERERILGPFGIVTETTTAALFLLLRFRWRLTINSILPVRHGSLLVR